MANLDDIIERLRSASEDIADRALSVLSEASRAGETKTSGCRAGTDQGTASSGKSNQPA